MEEYKSNSNASKEKAQEVKKITPIVSAPVKTKPKSAWNKFTDSFVSEDGAKIKDYILMDILLPSVKKTISDMVTNSVDMLLFGGKNTSSRSNVPATRVSYRSYYDSGRSQYTEYSPRSVRSSYNYDDIVLKNRGDADAVLNEMDNIIRRYGFVKVADLYDLVGIQGSYTDNNYGWTDLRYAEVVRQRDGYLLKFPRPMPIE